MKNYRPSSVEKENEATKSIERNYSKGAPLDTINNLAKYLMTNSQRLNATIKEYLKCAHDSGIVNEVRGKAVAGFYMVNVSLEKRVFRIGSKKKRVPKIRKQRCKVNKSSFDQRNNRSGNDLLYI